ncbi:DUF262 domain-containing protein [Leifsonia sp. 2MCAF36]|uniref:DUF262 domain-containing protein n=1 Tax=Leifsonia sp. 2MCAF36 TaxID=3232988 RepID=UPI003F9D4B8C
MGYQPPTTIAESLRRIQRGELILPAIQREYVWKPEQVVALFDSIMRGYPIGGFLSWKVDPGTVQKFRFYGFLKDYNELSHRHNPALDVDPSRPVIAVLDGQQRLTSLNVGLRGSYAWKKPRAWANLSENYPRRTLHLNVLSEADSNEAGLRYDFRFLTDEQASAGKEEGKFWFPVRQVFEAEKMVQLWAAAAKLDLANDEQATEILGRLWEAVHTNQGLHFYEETDQDVERVLDIFIRVNSAGTVLSYSDLLLSIATAQWKERDAREAIHGLVDNLNSTGQGFRFSQDVVLKSGLVLAGVPDIAFKVRNFTAANMATLDRNWDVISSSLQLAAGLLSDFGLSAATLSASSVLIPIAYYVHRRGLTQNYRESVREAKDRELLRSWTLRSLIMPGVWGSGLDTLLRDLRQVILDYGKSGFPAAEIEKRMTLRGKSLVISDAQVEEILDLSYGSARTFAVLATLFPHVNTRNLHHVDHIFPQSLLSTSKLKEAGLDSAAIGELQDKRDRLANLQLLEGLENVAKSDVLPAVWAEAAYPTEDALRAYQDRNVIVSLPSALTDFDPFYEARRVALARRISSVLGGTGAGGNTATAPQISQEAGDLQLDRAE